MAASQLGEVQEAVRVLWSKWTVIALIGEGAHGKVYKAVRKDAGGVFYSAIKHIAVPGEASEPQARRRGNSYENAARQIIQEIQMMYALRAEPNIVVYEDHEIIHEQGTNRWDIFIRMELLTPFRQYRRDNRLRVRDVVRLGVEICAALEACARKNIVHRDVKEDNIFVGGNGAFKLGDFGIARQISAGTAADARGTPAYIAPEIYHGKPYGASADVYSLGMLLYRLLNGGKPPFLEAAAKPIGKKDAEAAFERRMRGDALPAPVNCDEVLTGIILKACAFAPADRFQSAAGLRRALLDSAPVGAPTPSPKPFPAPQESQPQLPTVHQERTVKIDRSTPKPVDAEPVEPPAPPEQKHGIFSRLLQVFPTFRDSGLRARARHKSPPRKPQS